MPSVTTPLLTQLAEWTLALKPSDVPERIKRLGLAQTLSVLAAAASGRLCEDGQAVLRAQQRLGEGGKFALLGGGSADLLAAIDIGASWSMAQDYDDYMFMGHTGHSAVWTALYVGAWRNVDADEMATCIAIGNELGGRLGASLLLGPHNGQMWVPIHRIAAAAITARLLKLSVKQTADAMATALYDANDPVFRGFMGPGSKLRSAASSATAGVQAALLAAEGIDGAHDILEHPQGFWARFTYAPILGTFRGLGQSWAADTLAVKPYPGCAYVDTTVAALYEILADFKAKTGRALQPSEVKNIAVNGGALTLGMNALSAGAVAEGTLSPVVINFSIPLTAASTVLFGGLTGADLTAHNIETNAATLRAVAAKVELHHDLHYTVRLLRGVDDAIPTHTWIRAIRWSTIWQLRTRARQNMGDNVDRAVLPKGITKTLTPADRKYLRNFVVGTAWRAWRSNRRGEPNPGMPLEAVDFRQVRLMFPARAALTLQDGSIYKAECIDPPGVAYNSSIHDVARAKFLREAGRLFGKKTAKVMDDVLAAKLGPQKILEILS